MHNIKFMLQKESFVCAYSYPYVDRLHNMYTVYSKHIVCFPFVPSVSSVRSEVKVYDKNIVYNQQGGDFADV